MYRTGMLVEIIDGLRETKTRALEIRESMPWVTEGEQQDLLEKVDETLSWIEGEVEKQEQEGSLTEEPLFTQDKVEQKMKKL